MPVDFLILLQSLMRFMALEFLLVSLVGHDKTSLVLPWIMLTFPGRPWLAS